MNPVTPRAPRPGVPRAGLGLLLLRSLAAGAAASHRGARALPEACGGPEASSGAGAGGACGSQLEEEFEDQVLLQTRGDGRPSLPDAGAREPRTARALQAAFAPGAQGGAQAERGVEDQALLQKYRRAPRLQAGGGAAPESAGGPRAGGGAAAPERRAGGRGTEAAAPGGPAAPHRGAAEAGAPEEPLRGTSPMAAALQIISAAALLSTGAYLRCRRRPGAKAEAPACEPSADEPPSPEVPEAHEDGPSPEAEVARPAPMPRLPHVGTSFVVPFKRISECPDRSLSIDVPVIPAVWPLRASFSRPAAGGPWGRIDLTVDIIDAAGLPPLLSCGPPGALCPAPPDGGSGGTGAPDDEAAATPGGAAWLEVRGGSGALAALLVRGPGRACTVQRPGQAPLELRARLGPGPERWVAVRRQGREVGLATRLCQGKFPDSGDEEYFQVDTQPDTGSPESVLLLMTMLAMVAFQADGQSCPHQSPTSSDDEDIVLASPLPCT